MVCNEIDLKSYYNARGIEHSHYSASFSAGGAYFPAANFPHHITWKNGISFRLAEWMHEKFDHIECDGQEVKVDIDFVREILFLGASDNGSFTENISVSFEDGNQERLSLQLPNWVGYETEHDGDRIIIGKELVIQGRKMPMDSSIWIRRISISKGSGKIRSIHLPINMFMHVFAISVVTDL